MPEASAQFESPEVAPDEIEKFIERPVEPTASDMISESTADIPAEVQVSAVDTVLPTAEQGEQQDKSPEGPPETLQEDEPIASSNSLPVGANIDEPQLLSLENPKEETSMPEVKTEEASTSKSKKKNKKNKKKAAALEAEVADIGPSNEPEITQPQAESAEQDFLEDQSAETAPMDAVEIPEQSKSITEPEETPQPPITEPEILETSKQEDQSEVSLEPTLDAPLDNKPFQELSPVLEPIELVQDEALEEAPKDQLSGPSTLEVLESQEQPDIITAAESVSHPQSQEPQVLEMTMQDDQPRAVLEVAPDTPLGDKPFQEPSPAHDSGEQAQAGVPAEAPKDEIIESAPLEVVESQEQPDIGAVAEALQPHIPQFEALQPKKEEDEPKIQPEVATEAAIEDRPFQEQSTPSEPIQEPTLSRKESKKKKKKAKKLAKEQQENEGESESALSPVTETGDTQHDPLVKSSPAAKEPIEVEPVVDHLVPDIIAPVESERALDLSQKELVGHPVETKEDFLVEKQKDDEPAQAPLDVPLDSVKELVAPIETQIQHELVPKEDEKELLSEKATDQDVQGEIMEPMVERSSPDLVAEEPPRMTEPEPEPEPEPMAPLSRKLSKKEKRKLKKQAESEAAEPQQQQELEAPVDHVKQVEGIFKLHAQIETVGERMEEPMTPSDPIEQAQGVKDVSSMLTASEPVDPETPRELVDDLNLPTEDSKDLILVPSKEEEPEPAISRKLSKKAKKKKRKAEKAEESQLEPEIPAEPALPETPIEKTIAEDSHDGDLTPRPDEDAWPSIEWEKAKPDAIDQSSQSSVEAHAAPFVPEIPEFKESAIPEALLERPGESPEEAAKDSKAQAMTGTIDRDITTRDFNITSVDSALQTLHDVEAAGEKEKKTEEPESISSKIASIFPNLERGFFRRPSPSQSVKDGAEEETMEQASRDNAIQVLEAPVLMEKEREEREEERDLDMQEVRDSGYIPSPALAQDDVFGTPRAVPDARAELVLKSPEAIDRELREIMRSGTPKSVERDAGSGSTTRDIPETAPGSAVKSPSGTFEPGSRSITRENTPKPAGRDRSSDITTRDLPGLKPSLVSNSPPATIEAEPQPITLTQTVLQPVQPDNIFASTRELPSLKTDLPTKPEILGQPRSIERLSASSGSTCELRRSPSIHGRHDHPKLPWSLEEPAKTTTRDISPKPLREQGTEGAVRDDTPRLEMKPEHVLPRPETPVRKFTENALGRQAWPTSESDEDWEKVQKPSSGSLSPERGSRPRILKTPEQDKPVLRPSRPGSTSSSTHSLRRVVHSASGDLRAAALAAASEAPGVAESERQSRATTAQPPSRSPTDLNVERIASSSSYDPVIDKGKKPARTMTDVYEGWGETPSSPRSPSRPPSVRHRRSMQHLQELEFRLDHLISENRELAAARDAAEDKLRNANLSRRKSDHALNTRAADLRDREAELEQLRQSVEWFQKEVARLNEENTGLATTNTTLIATHTQEIQAIQQDSTREVERLRSQNERLSVDLHDRIKLEIETALTQKNAELRRLREELEGARDKVKELQEQISAQMHDNVIAFRGEDYFEAACQKLCGHVQQWVLRFSKHSDSRRCRKLIDIQDEKIADRFDNAILDGSDTDSYLADRVRRRDVFMSVVMTMVWEFVFTRYLFGMDREQRQKLKSLEKQLIEVGPRNSIHRWRATTLTLLSRRAAFAKQRESDTEAVALEIFETLSCLLPPPSHVESQLLDSLRKVLRVAVNLSIEMRTQLAEFIMLPPLQPEYDTNGDLARQVFFNAALMNERSGETTSNDELQAQNAIVRVVLFPLVVKKGNDAGEGEEEVVVCPAQVLIARPGKDKRLNRMTSGDRMSVEASRSVHSIAPSTMDMSMNMSMSNV
ncbi:hypothetical protein BJY04DRAFT_202342, partial [Aspergillus karnatakaensis]|uniref:involucrin repeat protein n=1 Tax=Aspergillus karnatakaensis TaxID=1810916 RepID=UPI003CCD243C